MRIALVSTPFVPVPPRGYGGTELVVDELVQGLTARGHAVTLFATGDSRAPDLRYLFPRRVWPPTRRAEARHCAAALAAIARERFDVVHVHAPALLELPPAAAPVVYTIHHDRDERLLATYARRRDVRYVAISRRQASLLPEVPADVVHHGLSPHRYPRGRGDGGYALFLGRLVPCKGPHLAIEAARRAGVPLRLAGAVHAEDGPPGWQERIDALLALPGVKHVGPVAGLRKVGLLGGACAALMPLQWEEPFGLVMIEAMLCGTPVIAYPRGAAPEIVDERVTGFLVTSTAEMAAALRALDGFDREACRRRAQERFAAGRMVRAYEAVYEAAAGALVAPADAEESSYAP